MGVKTLRSGLDRLSRFACGEALDGLYRSTNSSPFKNFR
jgi:hypothetical protein